MLVDKHIYIYLSMKEVEVSLCFVFNLISYVGFFIHCFFIVIILFQVFIKIVFNNEKKQQVNLP